MPDETTGEKQGSATGSPAAGSGEQDTTKAAAGSEGEKKSGAESLDVEAIVERVRREATRTAEETAKRIFAAQLDIERKAKEAAEAELAKRDKAGATPDRVTALQQRVEDLDEMVKAREAETVAARAEAENQAILSYLRGLAKAADAHDENDVALALRPKFGRVNGDIVPIDGTGQRLIHGTEYASADALVKELQRTKAHWFANKTRSGAGFSGAAEGKDGQPMGLDGFRKLSGVQRVGLKNANPTLYRQLADAEIQASRQ